MNRIGGFLNSTKRRVLASVGVLSLAITGIGIGLAQGATAPTPTGTLAMAPGTSLKVTCANTLTNSLVLTRSETLTCQPTPPPPPTTTTTTVKPPPTTTTTVKPPPTTTTTTVKPPPTTTTTVPPTTTTTTAPAGGGAIPGAGSGGTCTNPSFTSSNAQATDNTDSGSPPAPEFWWVSNDAWNGSHGPQTIQVCSPSSWNAVSNQPDIGGQVEVYPDTEMDVNGRDGSYPSTKPISAYTSITSTFSENFPTTGDTIDAAYDLWTNNFANETMIWNEATGDNSCYITAATNHTSCGSFKWVGATTLSGASYNVLNSGGAAGETIFLRVTQVKSGTVDILAVYKWEVANGLASASDAPTQLEYGVEISGTTGTQTFPMTGLSFNLS